MKKQPSRVLLQTTNTVQHVVIWLSKYQRHLYLFGSVVLLGTVGRVSFTYYQREKNQVAQSEMFQAVYFFEQSAFDKALHGDGTYVGLLDIVKEYPFTQATNLAHLYIGISYMHQKEYTKAIKYLTKFRSRDLLLRARAWALIGDAYTENKNYKSAATYYVKAANYKANEVFSPIYLVKAALAYEANKHFKEALSCYQRIIKEYPNARQYGVACKHVARLQGIDAATHHPSSD